MSEAQWRGGRGKGSVANLRSLLEKACTEVEGRQVFDAFASNGYVAHLKGLGKIIAVGWGVDTGSGNVVCRMKTEGGAKANYYLPLLHSYIELKAQ